MHFLNLMALLAVNIFVLLAPRSNAGFKFTDLPNGLALGDRRDSGFSRNSDRDSGNDAKNSEQEKMS